MIGTLAVDVRRLKQSALMVDFNLTGLRSILALRNCFLSDDMLCFVQIIMSSL